MRPPVTDKAVADFERVYQRPELLGSGLINCIHSAPRIWFLRRREGAGNLTVFKAFQRAQGPNPRRRMDAVNEP